MTALTDLEAKLKALSPSSAPSQASSLVGLGGDQPASAPAPSAPSVESRLSALEEVVKSLGGAQFGHRGNDSGRAFHAWWDRLTGAKTLASAPVALPQAVSSPSPSPLSTSRK